MQTLYASAFPSTPRKPLVIVLAVLSVAAIPVWLYLQLFREALIDDTFITLQYARTLRGYGVWGFFPWEVTNTATSPLNVLLTACSSLLVPDLVQAALLLATIEALILFGTLLLLSKHISNAYSFGVLSFIAIMLNPLLISTLGLEPLLYTMLLMACIYAFTLRRYMTLAILLALLTLTRPDGCLLFPIMFGAILVANQGSNGASSQTGANVRASSPPLLRIMVRFCLMYILCLMPWYLFSWIYLGSLVPTTLLIKRAQGTWEGYNFFNGVLFYYQRYPMEVTAALLLVPFALICLRLKTGTGSVVASMLFCFSSLYFIAYVMLGVPPYHWYFVPVVIPWSVLGVLGITSLLQGRSSPHKVTRIAVYSLICLVPLAGMLSFANGRFPLEQSPIHTNWATHNRYREIGLWLHNNIDAEINIQLWGEIGTVAYYSDRRLVDVFSCRLNNRDILRQTESLHGVRRLLARANYFWLRPDTACTPSTYELVMYNYAPAVVDLPPHIIEQWSISTDWVARGRVVLARQ